MTSLYKSRFFLFSTSFQKPMTSSLFSRPHHRAQLLSLSPLSSNSNSSSPFHTTPSRSALKEGDIDRDGMSEQYEQEKEDLLRNQKEGKASWHSKLASSSEENVKADRGEIDGVEEKDMEETLKKGKYGTMTSGGGGKGAAEKKC